MKILRKSNRKVALFFDFTLEADFPRGMLVFSLEKYVRVTGRCSDIQIMQVMKNRENDSKLILNAL
jgi:hypothetical protein